eukprot:245359_1
MMSNPRSKGFSLFKWSLVAVLLVTSIFGVAYLMPKDDDDGGLVNLWNTCYMNSVLQCLAHTRPVREYFERPDWRDDLSTREDRKANAQLASDFGNVVNQLNGAGEPGAFRPSGFYKSMLQLSYFQNRWRQEDAAEFLNILFDKGLDEGLNKKKQNGAPGLMESIFDNKTISLLKDRPHHAWGEKVEKIFAYHVEIPKPESKANIVTLGDCLFAYTQEERIKDNSVYKKQKKRIVVDSSEIFIIQLKRFEYDYATGRSSKNKTYVTIPETIDAGVLHKGAERKGGIRKFYNIYAIVCHHGKSKNNGHYTAYAKTQDGTWSHFDDSVVTPMGSFNDVPIKDAYILFYELQK